MIAQERVATIKGLSLPIVVLLADEIVSDDLKAVYGHMCKASLEIEGKSLLDRSLEELHDLGIEQCIILAGTNAYELSDELDRALYPKMNITIFHYKRALSQVLREFKNLSEPSGMLVLSVSYLLNQHIGVFLSSAEQSEYTLLQAVCEEGNCGLTLLKPTDAEYVQNAMPITIDEFIISKLDTLAELNEVNFNLKCDRYFYHPRKTSVGSLAN